MWKEKMNLGRFIFIFVSGLAVAGLAVLIATPHVERYLDEKLGSKVDERISQIKTQISKLETERISGLEAKLEEQEFLINFTTESIDKIFDTAANVNIESKGYGVARSKLGIFIISVENTSPYLDGHKITLNIGNLTSAKFNGAEISVNWGLPFDLKNYDAYKKSKKSKTFTVTDEFRPGAYSIIEIALTPAKPEEIKTISVGIKFNNVSLSYPKKNK